MPLREQAPELAMGMQVSPNAPFAHFLIVNDIEVNDPLPAVPEPMSISLLGTGLIGLVPPFVVAAPNAAESSLSEFFTLTRIRRRHIVHEGGIT